MGINRVSTYGIHQVTINNAIRLQSNIFDTQTQISSGFKASNFQELNGQVEQYTSLENKLAKSTQYQKNNALVRSRLDTVGAVLGQIIDSANQAKNLILQRRNQTSANSLAFEQQAQGYFKAIAGQLNLNQEGRYLFAGASTDRQPVKDSFPLPVEIGVPDDGYYQGSKQNVTARIQDEFEIDYSIRADAQGFQKIMAALAAAKEGDATKDDTLLVKAYDLMQEGINEVITLQASAVTNAGIIDKANERHQALDLYFKGLKEETINSDVVGLSTRLAVDQGILQASFQAFARINSLQLSNFLT